MFSFKLMDPVLPFKTKTQKPNRKQMVFRFLNKRNNYDIKKKMKKSDQY